MSAIPSASTTSNERAEYIDGTVPSPDAQTPAPAGQSPGGSPAGTHNNASCTVTAGSLYHIDQQRGKQSIATAAANARESSFSRLELLALLIAAAVHDVGHPGTNNAYQVQNRTFLSSLFQDQHVLEHTHVATTFAILRQPACDFLSELPAEEAAQVRNLVRDLVLATDLGSHRDCVTAVNNMINKPLGADYTSKEDRLALMKLTLKCSDVGHPARPKSTHIKWSELVSEEFHQQGDNERVLKLPISPNMDRSTFDLPKGQIGFIEFLVRPLFELLTTNAAMQRVLVARRRRLRARAQKLGLDVNEVVAEVRKGSGEDEEDVMELLDHALTLVQQQVQDGNPTPPTQLLRLTSTAVKPTSSDTQDGQTSPGGQPGLLQSEATRVSKIQALPPWLAYIQSNLNYWNRIITRRAEAKANESDKGSSTTKPAE